MNIQQPGMGCCRVLDTVYGSGPLVATAIHNGHFMSNDLCQISGLTDAERLREEDPFTADFAAILPNRVIGNYSRFEFDLNRPREKAVYQKPEDAWGLPVWQQNLPEDLLKRSLEYYDKCYMQLYEMYHSLKMEYGNFVVLDFHSYNHRRGGPDAEPASEDTHPQINIGTKFIPEKFRETVVRRFIKDLSEYPFPGGNLNVRENLIFKGGYHPQWSSLNFEENGCVIAVEVKKFFMDEWSSELNRDMHSEICKALSATIPGLLEELDKLKK